MEEINTRFYMAFESLSIKKMEPVWKHADDTVCIHPGWELFTGWTAIKESWESIFENIRKIEFHVSNIKIRAYENENIAIVVCLENINLLVHDENSFRTGVIATNIFERNLNYSNNYDNEWLMVHHHGSSVVNYMPPNVSV